MINPGDVSSWEMDYEFNVRVRNSACQNIDWWYSGS